MSIHLDSNTTQLSVKPLAMIHHSSELIELYIIKVILSSLHVVWPSSTKLIVNLWNSSSHNREFVTFP